MKLINNWNMSIWAYGQCLEGNDTPEMRNLITNDVWIAQYCIYVKNRKDMRSKLKDKDMEEYIINNF